MAARNEMLLLCLVKSRKQSEECEMNREVKRGGLEIHEYNSNNYELN